MRLVEIRDLDGPNLFLLKPAIKIELAYEHEQDLDRAMERLASRASKAQSEPEIRDSLTQLAFAARSFVDSAHADHGLGPVELTARWLETPNHLAIAFEWSHRRFALALAQQVVAIISGETPSALDGALLRTIEPDDRPLVVSDLERRVPVVGITGTNGKTTTTRLLAHILMMAGKHAGWSSTSGVYVDGNEVLSGDYSGPAGARRVLSDPAVEVAVLETARGGILLRGLACESNDVSVFTNVSGDHLNLHGIHTVHGLADVKAVVVRTTKPDGTAVLNGDDELVLAAAANIRAQKLLFSRKSDGLALRDHIASGGRALLLEGDQILLLEDGKRTAVAKASEMPITHGGRAGHMIENAMAAAGAAIGLGLDLKQIERGLLSFRNTSDQNLGRLNLFDVDGVTAIVDFAHNEAGLSVLLDFARQMTAADGRVTVVIGTAGDRTDESLREIGRLAAAGAERVIVKRTKKYERGRTNDEMIALYKEGACAAGNEGVEVAASELEGLRLGLEGANPGDVIALMCQEQMEEVSYLLQRIGRPIG
jgi:cyanophycin synthetase